MLCPQGLYREEFEEHKKAKGALTNKLKKRYALWKIRKDTEWKYKKTLFNAIISKNRQFYSNNQTKVALTSFCKMRYWAHAIHSVPFGHFSISVWFIIIKIWMIIAFFELLLPMHLLVLECLLKFALPLIIIPQYLHSTGCFTFLW